LSCVLHAYGFTLVEREIDEGGGGFLIIFSNSECQFRIQYFVMWAQSLEPLFFILWGD